MEFLRLKSSDYQAVHKWIRRELGKASHCSFNPLHNSTKYEWSNISRGYLWDVSDWQQLCPSCHRKFDYRQETREIKRLQAAGNTNRRIPVVGVDKAGVSHYYESTLAAAQALGVLRTSITNCLMGRTRTAGKYAWQYRETN